MPVGKASLNNLFYERGKKYTLRRETSAESSFLLEELTVAQLLVKYLTLYGTLMLITV
jgi:hypothetical protein